MNSIVTGFLAGAVLVVAAGVASARAASDPAPLRPDRLVVISATDVKGKTGPCGCRVPKGGLARRAGFVDSVRATYGQVALVDNGGFMPDAGEAPDRAEFTLEALSALDPAAVNVGERDLGFGRAFLERGVERTALPVVSANLLDRGTRRPLFEPYRIRRIGTVNVGFFGLMTDRGNLGPAADSVEIGDPVAAAKRTVAEMRRKGVQVVVLLSQLGKVESEDLVAAVEGIDAVIAGRNVPVLAKGRMVKNSVACYGGEQGHYACRIVLSLDPEGRMTAGEAEAIALGPEIAEAPSVREMVRGFEERSEAKGPGAAARAPAPGPSAAGASVR